MILTFSAHGRKVSQEINQIDSDTTEKINQTIGTFIKQNGDFVSVRVANSEVDRRLVIDFGPRRTEGAIYYWNVAPLYSLIVKHLKSKRNVA